MHGKKPPDGDELGRRFQMDAKYEILDTVGVGSMGTVYKARHRRLGRLVAIKVFLPGQQDELDGAARLVEEARILGTLRHENLVALFEAGLEEGAPYLVMEYVEGRDLARIIAAEAPMDPQKAGRWTLEILSALDAIHGMNVVHRDLKPANVLVDEVGRPRVTDFGLAKARGTNRMSTMEGLVLGTPHYMPPEQALAEEALPAWDHYALMTMLFEMLAGRVPFDGKDPLKLMREKQDRDPPALRSVQPRVPVPLARVVDRALSRDPRRRFADSRGLRNALAQALGSGELDAGQLSAAALPEADEVALADSLALRMRMGVTRRIRALKRIARPVYGAVALFVMLLGLVAFFVGGPPPAEFRVEQVSLHPERGDVTIRWTTNVDAPNRLQIVHGNGSIVDFGTGDRTGRSHAVDLGALPGGTSYGLRFVGPGGQLSLQRTFVLPSRLALPPAVSAFDGQGRIRGLLLPVAPQSRVTVFDDEHRPLCKETLVAADTVLALGKPRLELPRLVVETRDDDVTLVRSIAVPDLAETAKILAAELGHLDGDAHLHRLVAAGREDDAGERVRNLRAFLRSQPFWDRLHHFRSAAGAYFRSHFGPEALSLADALLELERFEALSSLWGGGGFVGYVDLVQGLLRPVDPAKVHSASALFYWNIDFRGLVTGKNNTGLSGIGLLSREHLRMIEVEHERLEALSKAEMAPASTGDKGWGVKALKFSPSATIREMDHMGRRILDHREDFLEERFHIDIPPVQNVRAAVILLEVQELQRFDAFDLRVNGKATLRYRVRGAQAGKTLDASEQIALAFAPALLQVGRNEFRITVSTVPGMRIMTIAMRPRLRHFMLRLYDR